MSETALLEKLVARCLESTDPAARLEALCSEHPDLASQLRARVEALPTEGVSLATSGLIGGGSEPRAPLEAIGPYRVLDTLGEGGMGTVYLAEQSHPVRRRVAMKVIKLGMDSKEVVGRFEQERQALALMDHEGIAKVFDCGTSETGQPYFVMELVRGAPINTYCELNRVSLEQRLLLLEQVCAAVQHAHQKGVIHRDLKPGNILVTDTDGRVQVKVIDFGLAKALNRGVSDDTFFTQLGAIMGTPEFMAPEQADPSNADIDTRADVYSIGVLLYELLVGSLPFSSRELRAAGVEGMQRMLRDAPTPRPSTQLKSVHAEARSRATQLRTSSASLRRALQSDLDWVVLRAMERDRSRRYPSVSAMADDLRRFRQHEPLEAGPPSAAYRVKKLIQRHRRRFVVAALLFLALLGGAAGTFVQWKRAESEAAKNLALAQDEQDARREAEAVLGFLENVMKTASPEENPDPDLTVRALFGTLADRVGRDLEDQPPVQVRLMQTVGNVFSSLGLMDEAREAWEEALRVHREASLPDEVSTGLMLMYLADLFRQPEVGADQAMANLDAATEIFTELQREDLINIASGTRSNILLSERASADEQFMTIVGTMNRFIVSDVTGQRRDASELDLTRDELLELMERIEEDWREGRREEAVRRARESYARSGLLEAADLQFGFLLVAASRFADWCVDNGREVVGEACLRANLALAEERFPPGGSQVRNARVGLADQLIIKGELVEAEELLASVFEVLPVEDEPASLSVSVAARLLRVRLRLRPGEAPEARLLRVPQSGAIKRRRDTRVAWVRDMVTDLAGVGRRDQAVAMARRCLGPPEAAQGEQLDLALLRADLAAILAQGEDLDAAEAELLAAHRSLVEGRVKAESEVEGAELEEAVVEQLVELYQQWGKPAEAQRWASRRSSTD